MTRRPSPDQQEEIDILAMNAEQLLRLVLGIEEGRSLPEISNFSQLVVYLRALSTFHEQRVIKRANHPGVHHDFFVELRRGRVPRLLKGMTTATHDLRYRQLAHGLLVPRRAQAAFQRLAELQQLGRWGTNGQKIVNPKADVLQELDDALNDLQRRILSMIPGKGPELLREIYPWVDEFKARIRTVIVPGVLEDKE